MKAVQAGASNVQLRSYFHNLNAPRKQKMLMAPALVIVWITRKLAFAMFNGICPVSKDTKGSEGRRLKKAGKRKVHPIESGSMKISVIPITTTKDGPGKKNEQTKRKGGERAENTDNMRINNLRGIEIRPARTGTISETAGAEQPRISAKLALALQKMADSKLIVSLRKAPQTNMLTNPAIEKILQRTKVPKEAHAEILHYVDMLKASKANGLSVGEFLAWIDDPGAVEIRPARTCTISLSPQEQTRKKLVKKNLKRVDSRTAVDL
jgi:hypothetical protein